jgi:hypothetical protein
MINKRAQRVNREDRNVRQLLYTPSLRFTKTLDPACSDVSPDFSRFHGDVFCCAACVGRLRNSARAAVGWKDLSAAKRLALSRHSNWPLTLR